MPRDSFKSTCQTSSLASPAAQCWPSVGINIINMTQKWQIFPCTRAMFTSPHKNCAAVMPFLSFPFSLLHPKELNSFYWSPTLSLKYLHLEDWSWVNGETGKRHHTALSEHIYEEVVTREEGRGAGDVERVLSLIRLFLENKFPLMGLWFQWEEQLVPMFTTLSHVTESQGSGKSYELWTIVLLSKVCHVALAWL